MFRAKVNLAEFQSALTLFNEAISEYCKGFYLTVEPSKPVILQGVSETIINCVQYTLQAEVECNEKLSFSIKLIPPTALDLFQSDEIIIEVIDHSGEMVVIILKDEFGNHFTIQPCCKDTEPLPDLSTIHHPKETSFNVHGKTIAAAADGLLSIAKAKIGHCSSKTLLRVNAAKPEQLEMVSFNSYYLGLINLPIAPESPEYLQSFHTLVYPDSLKVLSRLAKQSEHLTVEYYSPMDSEIKKLTNWSYDSCLKFTSGDVILIALPGYENISNLPSQIESLKSIDSFEIEISVNASVLLNATGLFKGKKDDTIHLQIDGESLVVEASDYETRVPFTLIKGSLPEDKPEFSFTYGKMMHSLSFSFTYKNLVNVLSIFNEEDGNLILKLPTAENISFIRIEDEANNKIAMVAFKLK